MTHLTDITSEPIEHQPDRATAEHTLLHAGRLPTGSREVLARLLAAEGGATPTVEQMAGELGVSLSTLSLWIARSKRAGLLCVRRRGRHNDYRINLEELKRRAGGASR